MSSNEISQPSNGPGQRRRGMSEEEAAAYTGLSRSSLRQGRMDGIRDNRLPPPPYVRLGRKIIYLRDDLDAWLERYRVPSVEAVSRGVRNG